MATLPEPSSPRRNLQFATHHHQNSHPRAIEPFAPALPSKMSTIRPMRPNDLLLISSTNLDHLTETYNIGFYMEYLTKWPELCQVIEGIDGQIEGYSTSGLLTSTVLQLLITAL
jgi:hypothetical protein